MWGEVSAVLVLCLLTLGRAEDYSATLHTLANQLMMQQFFVEEKIRSDGASGLKQMRHNVGGTKTYHSATHIGSSAAACHDHANYIRTVGMGEIDAVLNGVDFRTRHNDYKLVMPHTKNKVFHATEKIPFPEVPNKVLKQPTVEAEIDEMKEWFRAFLKQDITIRDYRNHFRPILCFLEGAWTTDTETLSESFESERHSIEASSWLDLQEKIKFTSYGGSKSNLENLAYLPTTVINTTDFGPILAQWNYRILCHPLKNDLPLERLQVVDDLSTRMMFRRTMGEHMVQRAARFQIKPFESDEWENGKDKYSLLDKLMSEIPGVDNYGADLRDETFGQHAYKYQEGDVEPAEELNSGYYHRLYQVKEKGPYGANLRHRGFSDPTVFMAQTTNPHVAEVGYEHCSGRRGTQSCFEYKQRWTYAIPLEIIYLTPISAWNPYNIIYKGKKSTPEGATVNANGRNGGKTEKRAYDGANNNKYYLTPQEFFLGKGVDDKSSADTSNRNVGVLDGKGELRIVGPSGIRIMFEIEGVGTIRQRFPIFPVHGEYSSVWKELNALKDIALAPATHKDMFYEQEGEASADGKSWTWAKRDAMPEAVVSGGLVLELEPSNWDRGHYPQHSHRVEISANQVAQLSAGESVFVTTGQAEGHTHNLVVVYRGTGARASILVDFCDGEPFCEHPAKLLVISGTLPPRQENIMEE